MGRHSFFFKNYVTHLVLIVCAFAMAGGVFYYQMSNYALSAKQTELRTTVKSIAEQTELLRGSTSEEDVYKRQQQPRPKITAPSRQIRPFRFMK